MTKTLLPIALASALLAGGCSFIPQLDRPALPVADQFPAAASQTAGQVAAADIPWQQFFTDPRLQQVIQLALDNNRDLRVAVDNIEKARAQYGITRADLLPGITAQGQGTRSRSSAELSNSGQSTVTEQYTAQLGFTSYEIDFWGRVRNLSEAGLQAFLQSEGNQRNVQIGLVADVSNAWLTLAADLAVLPVIAIDFPKFAEIGRAHV